MNKMDATGDVCSKITSLSNKLPLKYNYKKFHKFA